jgi:hypothetical protein
MADISPIPETKITFFKSSGHRHDGLTSSIIDTSKYSIFDFGTDITTGSQDRARELTRTNNQNRFNQYIANFISTQVLAPAGIELLENSVRGIHIGANEITANEIAANTITANEITAGTITATQIAANTITSNEIQTGTITASDLASTITFNAQVVQSSQYAANSSTGWALLSNGDVSFGSGTFRGSLDIGGPDNDSLQVDTNGRLWIGNRDFDSAPFRIHSNGRTVVGNGLVTIATNGATNVAGVLTVSNTANISGALNVTSNSNISGNLTVGGTTINVGGAGSTTTIAGTLQVNSGTTVDGNLNVKGTTITIGNTSGSTTTVNGGLTVAGATIINNTITLNNSITGNGNITMSSGKYINVGSGSVIGGNSVVTYSLDPSGFKAYFTAPYGGGQILDVGQRIAVIGGSAASPSVGFVGDTSTGLYQVNSGEIGITAGGTLGAYFKASGSWIRMVATTSTATFRIATNAFGFGEVGTASSNRDLKKNIEEITNGLDIISSLKPSTFEWKPLPNDTEFEASLRPFVRDYGFIAEEVAEANPRLACWKPNITEDFTEEQIQHATDAVDGWVPYYWSESGMISVCVAAIKELKSRIEHLESELGYNS